MRIVREEAELVEALSAAQREAEAAFAEGTVYVERFPRTSPPCGSPDSG